MFPCAPASRPATGPQHRRAVSSASDFTRCRTCRTPAAMILLRRSAQTAPPAACRAAATFKTPTPCTRQFPEATRSSQPERSRSFNAGIDLHWDGKVAGRAGIGFFRTQVTGFVSGADVGTLLSECIDDNLDAACNKIARNADGTLQLSQRDATEFWPGHGARIGLHRECAGRYRCRPLSRWIVVHVFDASGQASVRRQHRGS